MNKPNGKAVLFLYEGETEGEFYPRIFKSYLDFRECKIRLSAQCLGGNFNINSKVVNAIYNYLRYLEGKGETRLLHVFVALDRERRAQFMAPIDLILIKEQVGNEFVKSVETIVATQDFESWLFIDIINIYKFLRVPISLRNIDKYKNYESFNNDDLSKLFSQHKKHYKKGKKVEGLLNALNLEKIYDNCRDLKNGIELMKRLCEKEHEA
jgi:hypothetical protein